MWQDKVQENLQSSSWWFSRGISVEEKSEGKRKLGGLVVPGMDGGVEGLISTALVAWPLLHVPVGERRAAAQHHPSCFVHYKIRNRMGMSKQPRHHPSASGVVCFHGMDGHSYFTIEVKSLPFSSRMNIS